jgi:hypothetical protein
MMTLPRVALLPVAALALIGLLVPALSGCTATKRRVLGRTVAIANVESVVPERGPVNAPVSKVVPLFGVIVENANGSVIVIADPSVNVPEVRAKVYGLDDRESRRSGTVPAWVAASIEKYDNVNTLQVLAADPSGENRSVDLRVVVPAPRHASPAPRRERLLRNIAIALTKAQFGGNSALGNVDSPGDTAVGDSSEASDHSR